MTRPTHELAESPVDFDQAVHVVELADGRFRGQVADGWDMGGHPNGGYLTAIVLRAMLDAVDQPDPLTVTAHFLHPATPGPVDIDVEAVRVGRRHSTLSAAMTQGSRPIVQVLATFTDLGSDPGPRADVDQPPAVDLYRSIAPTPSPNFVPPPITQQVELRLDPASVGFAAGAPSGLGRMEGWARFADGRPPTIDSLPLFADAFPPAVFNAGLEPSWVPTIELTVHFRARPAPGWLRARFTTPAIQGGYLNEDGELWDSSGRLVALSRQLAVVPRSASAPIEPDENAPGSPGETDGSTKSRPSDSSRGRR